MEKGKPKPPKGMKDALPDEMSKRRFVIDGIRRVLERNSFEEISIPAIEKFETLAKKAGGEIKDEIYCFKDKSGRELGLRFDFTVGNARIVSTKPELREPVKWYSIGKVWRYDQPQAGRYREFWQVNLEIFGSNQPDSDAEILATVNDSLKEIGLDDFIIKISSRKVVDKLANKAGIENKKEAFRAVDKLDKIGEKGVLKEMEKKGIDGREFLRLIKSPLGYLKREVDNKTLEKIQELENIAYLAKKYGVNVQVDLSIVRGIDYYTGFVFETFLRRKDIGSIASGGRFDSLVKTFGGKDTPATGAGIGIDRIMDILDKETYRPPQIFVATIGYKNVAIELTKKLRKEGFRVDKDLMNRSLKKQMDYCNKKGIDYMIILGEDEVKRGKYKVKNMKTGKEKEVNQNKIIVYFKDLKRKF